MTKRKQETVTVVDGEVITPEAETVEERLSRLEAVLARQVEESQAKDRIISQQAAKLALADDAACELTESRDKVRRLKERAVEAREAASAAKKSFEAAQEAHLELEEELLTGQQRLPFPPPEADAEAPAAPEDTIEVEIPDELTWRYVELSSLPGLTAGILAKLEAAGITTMGELSDYSKPLVSGYCRGLTDIDGIGQAAAEKIADAATAFFAEWAAKQRQALNDAVCEAVTATEAERGESLDWEFADSGDLDIPGAAWDDADSESAGG
jgi:hypothetical protein